MTGEDSGPTARATATVNTAAPASHSPVTETSK